MISDVIAAVCMLIYIAVRFRDLRFGSSAIIALLNDVLVVFAVYSVGRLSVGGTFIACMLTIIGYSINSTIVIFDRIREHLKKAEPSQVRDVVNNSISQTLTRTINTTTTTFVMVLALFILGVTSIKEFALALMAGIIGGAFSSVFLTGPLWYFMKCGFGKVRVGDLQKTNLKHKKRKQNRR